ncbi:MAG TPA: thioredoxin domain-containing protein [Pyrinomonadaceae bacterium]|jgi:protein-disulfide isomerase|nr:thioredoxin domain-containing protein [Pyrinomonadaceae bacterium]
MKKHLTLIMILAGALVGTVTGLLLFRSELFRPAPTTPPAEPLKELAKAAPGAEPAHVRGSNEAIVTIEEFADFQCPPCRRLHPELKQIEAEYGSKLRVIFRHLPLSMHEHAEAAARASEAAGLQNRFWEMHDLLFERQRQWSEAGDVRSVFIDYAREIGLDVERFKKDMDGAEVGARVDSDKRRAQSVEITGTPTLFLNGREIAAEEMSAEGIRAAINAALKGK